MASPFYVQPASYGPALSGLANQLGQYNKEQKFAKRFAEAKQTAMEAFQSGDPDKVAEAYIQFPELAKTMQLRESMLYRDEETRENALQAGYEYLSNPTPENAAELVEERKGLLRGKGLTEGDMAETNQFLELAKQDPAKAAEATRRWLITADNKRFRSIFPGKEENAAAIQEFNYLTEGLSEEEKAKAKRIKLGLDPRAMGSASQTIAEKGTAEDIAAVESSIAQGKEFGKLTGASRAKAIDAGFEKVQSLSKNISNLDNAIEAVRAGAGVGAIRKRFPSVKNSSVLLDQIQGELALDVVGAVTFGALSEGELELAKQVAIPTGLTSEELVKWLQDKKEAQQKLLDYFKEQIEFLDKGGTVAGFLRMKKKSEKDETMPPGTTGSPGTPDRPASEMSTEELMNIIREGR